MSLAAEIGHTNFITGDESKRLQFSAESGRERLKTWLHLRVVIGQQN